MRPMRTNLWVVLLVTIFALTCTIPFAPLSTTAFAQQKGDPAVQGKQGPGGRGAPPVILGPPAGVQPLEIDLFTSKNFYKDKANWLDKRYYRCNVPRRLTEMWNERRIGPNPPTSAS